VKAFAIIRHAKIKAGRHLVATGLHNSRSVHTPNADVDAAPVEVLIGSKKPHRDVARALKRLDIKKLKKDGNVAIEIVLAASPEYWASRGWVPGEKASRETLDLVDEWKSEQLAYLEGRFGRHLLASVMFHPDEASPHVHALIIPAQYRADGREKARDDDGRPILAWRLSSEKVLPGPMAMKKIVTEYAAAMAKFGLQRGEDRPSGTVRHKPLKQWQAEQAELTKELKEELMNQTEMTARAELDAARIRREAEEFAIDVRTKAEREAYEFMMAQAIMRKKAEDDAASTQLALDRELAKARIATDEAEANRDESEAIKTKLRRMLDVVETVFTKVRKFADDYLAPKGIMTSMAIGPREKAAADIIVSPEVAELARIKAFVSAKGTGNGR